MLIMSKIIFVTLMFGHIIGVIDHAWNMLERDLPGGMARNLSCVA